MIARPATPAARIVAALDTDRPAQALAWAEALSPHVGVLKCGLELFCAGGPAAVSPVVARGPVFLDLKLHDIPNTVAGAVRSVLLLGVAMLTIHAAGGAAMVAAAREAAEAAGAARPLLLAVTVLTSLSPEALAATGVPDAPAAQVVRLARLAMAAGADGLVCSPFEIAPIRDALGEAPALVVPGVRPAGADRADQARVATPEEAVAWGADWIVLGRPLTRAADPAAVARAVAAALPR
ncbi:MAG: orotidine-5'-phosphate decarboxylase [Acetobacteraceae bacterium]|nr:orotidine-5'-phosphate decarboxylase [Acetobacteraceae bacterium]MDW8397085.1 orotidine-5'-phosphate decarboxylase [Acetobacteraceae bacterium]